MQRNEFGSKAGADDHGLPLADDASYPPIEDYGAIGDGRSIALVSSDGSIDWLCLPHFSSAPLFAALLDRRRGGRFALRPCNAFRTKRRYVGDTNVLETQFETETGKARLTECMALLPSQRHGDALRPQAEVLRILHGLEGHVDFEMICAPRPNFGRTHGKFEHRGRLGWAYCYGDAVCFIRGDTPIECPGDSLVSRFRLFHGEARCVSLAYTRHDIAVVPTLGVDAVNRVEQTRQFWLDWSKSCHAVGEYRDVIVRSALVLKLLNFSLSGAVVAAPTTSLPECVGGIRNWDYRYCWLRDAAMTLQAFADLGKTDDAQFFMDWLLHTTRLSWPRLDVVYDLFGNKHLHEVEIDVLEGYRGSRPIRIGNGACDQLQLDAYGSVVQAAYDFVKRGGLLDRAEKRYLAGFGREVCKLWRQPDEGIWEKRSGRRHHTYSKVMCWVTLDRLLKLADDGILEIPYEQFYTERAAIESSVERFGFNTSVNSYVAVFGEDTPDASLLLAARYGYRSAKHPRMRSTFDYIDGTLADGDLLYRYPIGSDGLPGAEGAFGIASFWAVEYLALAGRVTEARARFEALLGRASKLGLYAEEFDPESGRALGNYPQAFTHVGLITAAMAIHRTESGATDGGPHGLG